jgi:hypothetical protein
MHEYLSKVKEEDIEKAASTLSSGPKNSETKTG